tara:strand:- start:1166 stop:1486 length:321 start_codon:yes stop_codon:yes gene_type:complete
VTIKEGLTNKISKTINSGEASGSSNFSAKIKAEIVNLQDELHISKYKSEYENILVQMDDYINLLMLKRILNINMQKKNGDISDFEDLNVLRGAKESLNDIVEYIDK